MDYILGMITHDIIRTVRLYHVWCQSVS